MVPSSPMLATRRLSGKNATLRTRGPWPRRKSTGVVLSMRRTDFVFHIPTVVGPAVAIQRPSGLKTTSLTTAEWPRSLRSYVSAGAFQRCTSASTLAVAISLPSGLYAIAVRSFVCLMSLPTSFRLPARQTRPLPVHARCGDEAAVGAERDRGHGAAAVPEHARRAAPAVPDTRDPVRTAGDDPRRGVRSKAADVSGAP